MTPGGWLISATWFRPKASPQPTRTATPTRTRRSFSSYSNPTNSQDFYRPLITVTTNQVSLGLPNFPGRRVTVQTSTNLLEADGWLPWLVPGNDGLPLAAGQTNTLSGPATDPARFFKIRIEEE